MKNFRNYILEKKINAEMSIPKDVEEIAEAFHRAGKDLFVVGGAVRDHLQGKTPHDYDLVTNALPNETKQILKDWNVSDEQGANFGVLRVYTEDEPAGHEIATYRKDIAKGRDVKGDDEKVEIGEHITINDDVLRRDLTINALFYDINNKEIVDLVGGVEDLKNNVIRTVGKPEERFAEDRLRILRVFRFAARTGGEIDSVTSNAIKRDNRLRGINAKEDVSQERIHEEWNKVIEHSIDGRDVKIMQKYLDLLTEYNMWSQMFPTMAIDTNVEVTIPINSIIFADLLKDNNITAKRRFMIRNLKFTSELVNEIEFLHFYEDVAYDLDGIGEYKLAKKKNAYHIKDDLIRVFMPGKFTEAFIKYCADGFVVDGNDLKEQGLKGKAIEDEKQRIENERFETEYLN